MRLRVLVKNLLLSGFVSEGCNIGCIKVRFPKKIILFFFKDRNHKEKSILGIFGDFEFFALVELNFKEH